MKPTTVVNKVAETLFDQVAMTHRFVVCIDLSKYDLGTWSKVAGLQVKWVRLSHRPGESNDEWMFPGNVSYSDIKLSRAACSESATVQQWLAETSYRHQPLSGAIYMLDFMGTPLIEWQLKQFFPIEWSVSELDSKNGQPAIETLGLAHSGFLHDEVSPR